jgi:hypothetical protein
VSIWLQVVLGALVLIPIGIGIYKAVRLLVFALSKDERHDKEAKK